MIFGTTDEKVLYSYAMSFCGVPYRWGGDDPMAGYDCSGFVQELLACVGLDPKGDQTAQALHDYFEKESTMSAFPDFGALAFYGSERITHVAFCLNRDLVLEAGGGGSRTHDLEDAKAQNAFIWVRPLMRRKDLVSVLMPRYSWLK